MMQKTFVFSRHSARNYASSFPISQELKLYEGLVLPTPISAFSKDLNRAGEILSLCKATRSLEKMVQQAYEEIGLPPFDGIFWEARPDLSTSRTLDTCINLRQKMRCPVPPIAAVIQTEPTAHTYAFSPEDTLLISTLNLSVPEEIQQEIRAHSLLETQVKESAARFLEQLFFSVQRRIVAIPPDSLPDVDDPNVPLTLDPFYGNLYNYASLIEMSACQGPPLNVIFATDTDFPQQKELVQKAVFYIDTVILYENSGPLGAYYAQLWIDHMNESVMRFPQLLVTHEARLLYYLVYMGFVSPTTTDMNIYPLHSMCVVFSGNKVCLTIMKPSLSQKGKLGPSFTVETLWKGSTQEYQARAEKVQKLLFPEFPLNPLYPAQEIKWV